MASLALWWKNTGRRFAAAQWRRLLRGSGIGCLIAIAFHLVTRDSIIVPTLKTKWTALTAHVPFDGVQAYRLELQALCVVLAAALGLWIVPATWRYLRAWWAGIVSLTIVLSAIVTVEILRVSPLHLTRTLALIALLSGLIVFELWRFQTTTSLRKAGRSLPVPQVPTQRPAASIQTQWQPSTSDDPIQDWSQDILERSSVVEVLLEHIFAERTPIVALHGGLGDGKTSVLNLLRRSLEGRAIIVSFSAWLPGTEETLAIDLFRDIATECRRVVYVPQLKKQSITYARTISGSVSYLAGLKEILPAQSQREEIEEIRQTLARVPLPIVVLIDEVDRMQQDELFVLLKILRGASSIPNVTFLCAFNEEEVRKRSSDKIGPAYLEKFFPVTVNLSAPEPEMIGRLFRSEITTTATEHKWFLGTDIKKFGELLEHMWNNSLSHLCTNLRKAGLVLNDWTATARNIGGEVNTLDLIGIETIRRFAPEVFNLVRKNQIFLTYGNDSFGQYISDRRKDQESPEFFKRLESTIAESPEAQAIRDILDLLFPQFTKELTLSKTMRPGSQEIAEKEKRICDSDYFSIYFRAAVPADMYSEAELARIVERLNAAEGEVAIEQIFSEVLDEIPAQYPKREDFLWKIGRSVEGRLTERAAEGLAYGAATQSAKYAYDLMNLGEAARALNIVFESAQRLSSSSKAQEILVGAMKRTADDTFAVRLLEFTEHKDRNKVLTNFSQINPGVVRHAFLERMRNRYGTSVDTNTVLLVHGEWRAFRVWANNSAEDREAEQSFWRRFIGENPRKLAQAINFLYPGGFSWSEDPRKIIEELFPMNELEKLAKSLTGESLNEVEAGAMKRFETLLRGEWFNVGNMDFKGNPES